MAVSILRKTRLMMLAVMLVLFCQLAVSSAFADPSQRVYVKPQVLPSAKEIKTYGAIVKKVAQQENVPEHLVWAVMSIESGYRPLAKRGSSYGLMQVSMIAAKSVGYKGSARGLLDPSTNIVFGTRYLGVAWKASKYSKHERGCAAVSYYNTGNKRRINQAYCAKLRWVLEHTQR